MNIVQMKVKEMLEYMQNLILAQTYYSEWSLIGEGYYHDSELIIAHGLWTGPVGI